MSPSKREPMMPTLTRPFAMVWLSLLSVAMYGAFDGRGGLAQILRPHGGTHGQAGVEGQEPGFGDGGQLGGILHVEKYKAAALAVVLGKIGGLGLEVGENPLDRGSQGTGAG